MKKTRKLKATKKLKSKEGKTSIEKERSNSTNESPTLFNESAHRFPDTEKAHEVEKVPSEGNAMFDSEKNNKTYHEPVKHCMGKDMCPSCENLTVWRRRSKNMSTDILDEERKTQEKICIGRLIFERDYYRKEFERLFEFVENTAASAENEKKSRNCIACQKRDQMIEYLQKENDNLAKEKHCLMERLESRLKLDMESPAGKCSKALCKRVERERDLLKLDVHRLEEETDCLRDKLKIISENKTREYARFQEQRVESESVIKKLEGEKRELMKSQGVRRVTINALEEKLDTYTNLLKVTQDELNRTKTQYHHLKKLHEQCDSALLDTQAQLMELETELLNYRKKKDTRQYRDTSLQYSTYTNDAITKPIRYIAKDAGFTFNHEKGSLERDTSKELLFQLQEETHESNKSNEEFMDLEEKVKILSKEAKTMKEQYNKSTMLVKEKTAEITRLQTENEMIMKDIEKCRKTLEEKEAQNNVLQAEVKRLKKETDTLTTSNNNLRADSNHARIQVSVAMENVNELEKKISKLEENNMAYEKEIQSMKSDLYDSQTQLNKTKIVVNNLRENNNSLQSLQQNLNIEKTAQEKIIYDLKCECHKLETDISSLKSIENNMDDMRKENDNLRKKVNRLENKLIQCVCAICDNAYDKCTLMKLVFPDFQDNESGSDILLQKTSEIGVQMFSEKSRNPKTPIISTKQGKATISSKDEHSCKVITCQNTLPIAKSKSCVCRKDVIISSMYQNTHSLSSVTNEIFNNAENPNKDSISLKAIIEESSSEVLVEEKNDNV